MENRLARKIDERPLANVERLHAPFYPAEVYFGQKISAELKIFTGEKTVSLALPVWRISPLGVELLVPENCRAQCKDVRMGTRVDLEVQISKQKCQFSGLVVFSAYRQKDRELIGIRWCQQANAPSSNLNVEKRRAKRWLCGTDFMPTGMAPNPIRFNDFIHFRVKDLSRNGMQLVTSLRNKYLIPGMVLDGIISFPMFAQLKIKLKITNARIVNEVGRDYLALGTQLVNNDPNITDAIGQYLFQFGPKTTVEELKSAGFKVKAMSRGLDFSFVQSEKDYLNVLELRRLSYSADGIIDPDTPLEKLADVYDTRARILVAKHHGRILGSVRLMFHNPEDSFEQEEFVKLPEDFPRKDESIEITRLCTHPDFRSSDLFYALVKQMIIALMQSGRTWFVSCTTDKMLPSYKKLGAKAMNLRYAHSEIGGLEHDVIVFNVPRAITGEGVNPLVWNFMFADMTAYLKEQSISDFEPIMNIRMGIYRMLSPLARMAGGRIRSANRKKVKK